MEKTNTNNIMKRKENEASKESRNQQQVLHEYPNVDQITRKQLRAYKPIKVKNHTKKKIMEIIHNRGTDYLLHTKIIRQLQQKHDLKNTANNLRKPVSIETNNKKSIVTPLSRLLKQKEENNDTKMDQ